MPQMTAKEVCVMINRPFVTKASVREQLEIDLKKFDLSKIKIGKTSTKKIR